jgi:hypothetical protein
MKKIQALKNKNTTVHLGIHILNFSTQARVNP